MKQLLLVIFSIVLLNNYGQEGLVAYFPFNNSFSDVSLSGNDLANENTTFTSDRFGSANSAALLNGSNSQLIFPNEFHLGESFTVCGWANSRTAQYNMGTLFHSDWSRGDWYYEPFSYSVYVLAHNDDGLNCSAWGGNNYIAETDSLEWYFWTISSDGSTLKTYFNGELIESHSVTPNYGAGTYFPARLGRITRNTNAAAGDLQNYWYNGIIDDVRIFDRPLRDEEISELYIEEGWIGEINPRDYKIRFSYETEGETILIEEKEYESNQEINNLRLEPVDGMLDMSGVRNSRSFNISVEVLNDNEPIEHPSISFTIENENYLNAKFIAEILYNDGDISDNRIEEVREIWMADFEYYTDNYSFENWGMNKSEIGFATAQIYLDPDWRKSVNKLPLRILNTLLGEFVSTGGHCYGMASTSLIYKNDPSWLLSNSGTFGLKETTDVINNIQYAFGKQARFWPLMAANALASTYLTGDKLNIGYANTQINFIKDKLSTNSLLVSNYNIHCTVLHTMIKESNNYILYESDNNRWKNTSPHQRGRFIVTENNVDLEFVSSNDSFLGFPKNLLYYFNTPDFDLPKQVLKSAPGPSIDSDLQSVLDTLVSNEIDSLTESGNKVMLYTDDSFETGDSTSNCIINIPNGILDSIDLISYKVYYLDPGFSEDIHVKAIRPGNFSIHFFNKSLKKGTTLQRTSFENQYFEAAESGMTIYNPFSGQELTAEIDTDGDNDADFTITSSENEISAFDENKPPNIIKYLPIQEFTDDILTKTFDLVEFISDEDFNLLTFQTGYDSEILKISITDGILSITALQATLETGSIEIIISDGENEVKLPIKYKSSITSGFSDQSLPNEITISPNPFSRSTEVSFPYVGGSYTLSIYDVSGRLVKRLSEIHTGNFALDRDELQSGIYFIHVNGLNNFSSKLIIE